MKRFFSILTSIVLGLMILTGIAAVSAYQDERDSLVSLHADGVLAFTADTVQIYVGHPTVSADSELPVTSDTNTVGNNSTEPNDNAAFVLNTSSKKIHKSSCASVSKIKDTNKAFTEDYAQAVADGFSPCNICFSES